MSGLGEIERYGPVTVLFGERRGRYPDGNGVLVEGQRETVIIDPALGTASRVGALPEVHRVLLSHCHEDHVAGTHLFPDVPLHLHREDLPGMQSLDRFMDIFGMTGPVAEYWRKAMVDDFNYVARPDARPFEEGDVFRLGGVDIEVMHTPGHTRGHSCFIVCWRDGEGAPRRFVYLGDIELTGFGPYYGDAWSSLRDFEATLQRVRCLEADWYGTFHHIGVLAGREAFLERFEKFAAMVGKRETRLLEFIAEPRTLDEIVAHRIVYRPQDDVPYADSVERRSAQLHLERLVEAGRVHERQIASETVYERA